MEQLVTIAVIGTELTGVTVGWIRRQLHEMGEALSASDSGCGCLMILFLAVLVLGIIFTVIWH